MSNNLAINVAETQVDKNSPDSAHAPLSLSRGTPVLVIDDESSITEVLAGVLKDEGYVPHIAGSGEAGIAVFETLRPPVVFLDMWMPGKDGIETLREIKAVSSDTQVIMISGHATITNALEAMKCGAFDFVEKPFTISAITATLERALEKYRSLSGSDHNSTDRADLPEGVLDIANQAKHDSIVGDMLEKASTAPLNRQIHPGITSRSCAGKNLGQRTIKESIVLYGQCLHSGVKSGLVLEPLPLNSGIHFSHLGSVFSVPAFVSNVESTVLATTLRTPNVSAATIEHLMASLYAYRISNLLIKCNGEVPIFDGSSNVFCDAIEGVGLEEQGGEWFEVCPPEPVVFRVEGTEDEIRLEPRPEGGLFVHYELFYPEPVGKQLVEFTYSCPQSFRTEIAPARTFGFMKDVQNMHRMGLAAGGRLNNFILIGSDGIINTDLRFPDELARHKVLDAIGDLFLLGRPLSANVYARMTGHADNVEVLRLLADFVDDLRNRTDV